MEAGVLVAIIAAIGSLVVALGNAGFTAYRERHVKKTTAKAELDRMREPLLRASLELAGRIDNIRNEDFLHVYLTSSDARRTEIARTSTLYRFARYWCIVEMLDDRVALLKFREHKATRLVADMLREIGRTFATDDYVGFMVWREEQRAIGEEMRTENTTLGCIGYATFVDRYDETFARWFSAFEQDLNATAAKESRRFAVLQRKLAVLARQLDSDHAYSNQWEGLIDRSPED